MSEKKKGKAAIYLRTATESPNGIELQKNVLIKLAEAKGFKIKPENIYKDVGSGLAKRRPGLNSLRQKIRVGKIKDLFVLNWARLARDMLSGVTLLKEFEKHGCKVWLSTGNFRDAESVDLRSEALHLGSTLFDTFENPTCSDIGKRTQLGLMAKAKKGLWPGGKPPFRYAIQQGKLHPLPSEARIVRKIYELAKFKRIHKIQETLRRKGSGNIPITRIYSILTNPVYKGDLVWGKKKSVNEKLEKVPPDKWIVVKDAHPALIDRNTWEQIQLKFKK